MKAKKLLMFVTLTVVLAALVILIALSITAFKSYEVNTNTYEEIVEEVADD